MRFLFGKRGEGGSNRAVRRDAGAPGPWQQFAMNLVDHRDSIGGDRVTFEFASSLDAEECINRFDQFALEQEWRYFAELVASDDQFTLFRITVEQSYESEALEAARQSSS